LIEDKGIEPNIIEYLNTPPNQTTLEDIVAMLGVSPIDIVRRKEAKEAGINAASMSDRDLIKAMTSIPSIIERPIVVSKNKAAIGRPPENILSIL
tara:strand:+ start:289 stop:573 length:285 start_codon:yes stop_codon:yes gene_type:complete